MAALYNQFIIPPIIISANQEDVRTGKVYSQFERSKMKTIKFDVNIGS